MAWTIDTYLNAQSTGPNGMPTAMFELCRGVNQRQAALGLGSGSTWYKADGTLTASISMADLQHTQVTGIAAGLGSYAYLNLVKIQDAIVSLIGTGEFTETTGRSDVWTLANVEATIGTNLTTAPVRATDARFWQAQQDALDLLIYVNVTKTTSNEQADRHETNVPPQSTRQLAWDNRNNTYVFGSVGRFLAAIYYAWFENTQGPDTWLAIAQGVGTGDILGMPSLLGVRTVDVYEVSEVNEASAAIEYTVGSLVYSMPSGTTLQTSQHEADPTAINLGGGTSLALEFTSLPTAEPLPADDPAKPSKATTAELLSVTVCLDLASILTDQDP